MQGSSQSWLGSAIERLDALYRKFGRDGLRDEPESNVRLFLASKQLSLSGADVSQEHRFALELEVKDLGELLLEKASQASRYKSSANLMIGHERSEPELEM